MRPCACFHTVFRTRLPLRAAWWHDASMTRLMLGITHGVHCNAVVNARNTRRSIAGMADYRKSCASLFPSSNATLCLALFAALMILSSRAPAQIFECIDADGKKEFTQKCAPGTVKQREVAKGGASNLKGGNAPPQTSYQAEEGAFRQRQIEREANESKEKAAAADAANKCQNAKARLTSIENARRVTAGTDPQTGERRFLDDKEREAATQKVRDAVSAYCR